MIPSSFRGHDVIGALVSLAETALPGVLVHDGPPREKPSEKEILYIGWAEFSQQHATATRDESDLGGRATERGEIACFVAVRSGMSGMAETRGRAVEILETFEASLRADDTRLGGTCDEVDVGPDMALTQHQTREGQSAGLAFSVSYVAYI